MIYGRRTTNCDVCDPEFALRVNLRRHDILTRIAMYVMPIFVES